MKLKVEDSTINQICVIIVSLLMFIPMSTGGNILRFFTVITLFFIKNTSFRFVYIRERVSRIYILICINFVLAMISAIILEYEFNQLLWLHELSRVGFYFVLLLLISQCSVRFKFIYTLCKTLLLIHLSIQIMQAYSFFDINSWIRDAYVIGEESVHFSLASASGSNFRSGSVFLNPNVYMFIPCSVLCVIFQNNILYHNKMDILWIIASMYSMVLTGSRTTLVIFAFIVLFFVFKDKKVNKLKFYIIAIIAIVFSYLLISDTLSNFRIFNVLNSVNTGGSLNVKTNFFFNYLENSKLLYYITGAVGSYNANTQIDFEWGYIFSYYGLLGLLWYLVFLRNMGPYNNSLRFMRIGMKIIIASIGLTATVFFCMPMFPFVCILTFVNIEEDFPVLYNNKGNF